MTLKISGSITAPGELDNLGVFYFARSRNLLGQDQYPPHVSAYGEVVGEAVQGRIGVDKSGFREDWAVVNVDQEEVPEWGVVGSWRAEIAC